MLNLAVEVVGYNVIHYDKQCKTISIYCIIDYGIMDYAFNSSFTNDAGASAVPEVEVDVGADVGAGVDSEIRTDFIYDDRRDFSRIYILCKYAGLVFYITILVSCYKPIMMAMVCLMFVSTVNSARYEYAHEQRYGTSFSSIAEFESWKQQLYPKSRLVFSLCELGMKIWYSIESFPPRFTVGSFCEMGETILNIHITIIFMIYIFVSIFSIYILYTSCCYNASHYRTYLSNNHGNRVSPPVTVTVRPLEPVAVSVTVTVSMAVGVGAQRTDNDECCICLDNENTQSWAILPCGHKFHGLCISQWVASRHSTCPVCRTRIS